MKMVQRESNFQKTNEWERLKEDSISWNSSKKIKSTMDLAMERAARMDIASDELQHVDQLREEISYIEKILLLNMYDIYKKILVCINNVYKKISKNIFDRFKQVEPEIFDPFENLDQLKQLIGDSDTIDSSVCDLLRKIKSIHISESEEVTIQRSIEILIKVLLMSGDSHKNYIKESADSFRKNLQAMIDREDAKNNDEINIQLKTLKDIQFF